MSMAIRGPKYSWVDGDKVRQLDLATWNARGLITTLQKLKGPMTIGETLSQMAEPHDVFAIVEVKGKTGPGVGQWNEATGGIRGLCEPNAVPGFSVNFAKGNMGMNGIVVLVRNGILHNPPISGTAALPLLAIHKGRLWAIELVPPRLGDQGLLLVVLHGPSKDSENPSGFWQRAQAMCAAFRQRGVPVVLAGTFNNTVGNMPARLPQNWAHRDVLAPSPAPGGGPGGRRLDERRSTFGASWMDASLGFPVVLHQGVNHFNLNVESNSFKDCWDTIAVDDNIKIIAKPGVRMCGCNQACQVPCSDPDHAEMANNYWLAGVAANPLARRTRIAGAAVALLPKGLMRTAYMQLHYPAGGGAPVIWPQEMTFPFTQQHALIRYFPPAYSDHALITVVLGLKLHQESQVIDQVIDLTGTSSSEDEKQTPAKRPRLKE